MSALFDKRPGTSARTFSQQAMQVVDDQVVVDTVLDQPLGALRDVSYQLFAATRSSSPPSNNGQTSSASPGSSRS